MPELAIRVILGIVLAVIAFVVLTTIIHFKDSGLIFGLVALLVFLACVFAPYRRRSTL
jgi:hypothetical protein